MKKSIDYTSYFFAIFIPGYSILTNNLFFKHGLWLNWILSSFILLGLWHCNQKLLSLSDNLFAKWGILILGSNAYIILVIFLDYYVFHKLLAFTGFSPLNFCLRLSLFTLISAGIIEGIKWAKAREQSQLENLTLQTEYIENQFNLLIQQTNPEFLFHSLTTLQKMVGAGNPQAEAFILKLANVYRQTLKKERNPVSLREELDFLRSYLFLMRYGKENAIFWEEDISDASLSYRLPIFSLQLLAENCLKYHVFSPEQALYIRIFQKNPQSISISNNYQPNDLPSAVLAAGIEHLNMRYALDGIENGLMIEQNEKTYTATLQLF